MKRPEWWAIITDEERAKHVRISAALFPVLHPDSLSGLARLRENIRPIDRSSFRSDVILREVSDPTVLAETDYAREHVAEKSLIR